MITFTMLSTKSYHRDLLGLIPTFFSETDPRSAAEQIHEAYVYGGGWHPLQGWKYAEDTGQIVYPGDPPLRPFAIAILHGSSPRPETILVYPYAWVAIVQADGSFEVSRID